VGVTPGSRGRAAPDVICFGGNRDHHDLRAMMDPSAVQAVIREEQGQVYVSPGPDPHLDDRFFNALKTRATAFKVRQCTKSFLL